MVKEKDADVEPQREDEPVAEAPGKTPAKVEYVTDDGPVVVTTASEVNQVVKDTPWRRAARTGLQYVATIVVLLLVLGGFDALFDRAALEAPIELKGIVTLLGLMAVSYAQNYIEEKGIAVPVFGTKANVKEDSLP